MKRLILSTFVTTVGFLSAIAGIVSQQRALELCESFLSSRKGTRSDYGCSNLSIESYKDALFIINNPSGGWVLVGADDSLPQPILGYSDQGSFSIDKMSDAARWVLDEYVSGIVSLGRNNRILSAPSVPGNSVAPLLGDIAWDQYEPFNDLFPVLDGLKTVAGCTNVAVGQIMRYYQHPARGNGSFSYTWDGVEYSANFENSEYHWDLMKPQYSGEETKEEREAVAALIYDVAVSNQSAFGPATGAGFWIDNFVEFFNYDKSIRVVDRYRCGREDSERIMREEIDAGRPIFVAGAATSYGAHAFVCDGYDSEGFFHYNFGWGSYNNGYFLSTATGYDSSQTLTVSIMPEQGGLPGLWAGSMDDIMCSGTDHLSCNIDGSISLNIPVDIEVALAVENKQNGHTDYRQTKVFNKVTGFSVSEFTFSDNVEDGTYDLYPVCRVVGNAKWDKVCFADNCANHVELEVNNGEKTYTNVGVGGVIDDDVVEFGGAYFRIYDNEAKVTRRNSRGKCYKEDVVIPAEIEHQGIIYPVTAIGEYAFYRSEINSLTIGKNVREFEFASFSNSKVNHLYFVEGSELKSVGGWAFNGCKLPELRLPYGLETIGTCALRGDINLLDIPETVIMLSSEAISCEWLNDVYVHWKDIASMPEYMEWSISANIDDSTLHVPAGCTELYSNHELWMGFPRIVDDADSGVKGIRNGEEDIKVTVRDGAVFIESTDNNVIGQIYSAQGVRVGTVKSNQSIHVGSGVFIVTIRDKAFKILL